MFDGRSCVGPWAGLVHCPGVFQRIGTKACLGCSGDRDVCRRSCMACAADFSFGHEGFACTEDCLDRDGGHGSNLSRKAILPDDLHSADTIEDTPVGPARPGTRMSV